MKKIIMTGSAIALIIMILFVGNLGLFEKEVLGETEIADNIVSVNGVGSITVKPDIAYISIGVETENIDAAVAQEENAKNMTAVMDAIKASGIKEDDIKTINYSIYNRYNYFENGDKEKYYVVSNTVEVTIRDISKVGDLIDATAKVKANQISSIRFGISNEDEVYSEALKLAMESAKLKATSIMSTFGEDGKEPGIPSRVSETSYFSGVVRSEYAMDASEKSSFQTPISSGELTITANVSVEYSY